MARQTQAARPQTETSMQMAVVRWARKAAEEWPGFEALRWLFHTANEGKVDPREAGKRQSMGVLAGVSDLLLLARSGRYSGLCLELKRKPNRLSAEQRAFLDFAAAQGYKAAVAYSVEEAQAVITSYLQGQNQDERGGFNR
ncbi:VRR-NUC domain-containing protein [bacterium]|nr:VRR-NUC domain-containing protein [bacterium]